MIRRPRLAAVLALLLLALLVGCSDDHDGTVVPAPVLTPSTTDGPTTPAASPSGTPTTPAPPTSTSEPPPRLVSWGRTGGLVSLVVRNAGDREVRSATVLISLYDAQHRLVKASTGQPRSTCCTVLRLPPGRPYGLFLNVGPRAAAVASVEVRYTRLVTGPWPRPRPTRITARDAELLRTRHDAVVTATLSTHGPLRPFIVGQAFLTDRHGHLRAVISGRFYCFHDGTAKRLRMQLLHPVPPGTRIGRVLGYPIPPGQPTLVRGSCR